MNKPELTVSTREGKGRGYARRLRAQGRIPAVIYGRNGSTSLSLAERDFLALMRRTGGAATVITLVDEKQAQRMSVIQAMQRDSITDRFKHVDFFEVSADHLMTASIHVHTIGEAKGVKTDGGVLDISMHELEVSCLPADLPEFIEIDVSHLAVGDAVHIREIKEIPGVTFLDDANAVVVSCVHGMTEADLEPSEVTAETEVTEEAGEAKSESGDEASDDAETKED